MKVGAGADTDIERIRQVSAALRPGNVLAADANTGWRQHEALRVTSAIRDIDIYIEQPCLSYEECHADPSVTSGKVLYQQWCAACHAAGPGHPGTQALDALYKGENPAVLEERTDLQPATIAYFVRNGRSTMPSFRKTEITDAELAEIGAYLSKAQPEKK